MISKIYTGFYGKNGYWYKPRLVFGCQPYEIERFEEAIQSKEEYVPHHILECRFTVEELEELNRYENVLPEDLIWMPRSIHDSNPFLHKGCRNRTQKATGSKRTDETKRKMSESQLGKNQTKETKDKLMLINIKTEFGRKYYEHYGYSNAENRAQYMKERRFYKKYNKCSWE